MKTKIERCGVITVSSVLIRRRTLRNSTGAQENSTCGCGRRVEERNRSNGISLRKIFVFVENPTFQLISFSFIFFSRYYFASSCKRATVKNEFHNVIRFITIWLRNNRPNSQLVSLWWSPNVNVIVHDVVYIDFMFE